jgi:putative cell wall-binding protein
MRSPSHPARTGVALVLVLALGGAAPVAGGFPPEVPQHPRLDPHLEAVPREAPGLVAVEIYGFGNAVPVAAVAALGATEVVAAGEVVFATIPIAALPALASHRQVRWIRPVSRPYPDAVSGQGITVSNADDWHAAGVNGAEVKVAIIDSGFEGYTDRQLSGDLPLSLTTQNYCFDNGDSTFALGVHGAGVAEIVYEMAPNAQLYLICVDSGGDLALAVDYAIANGVRVINESMSWFPPGRGDGSGFLEPIVTDAHDAGIVWVNSAGNEAQNHWGGTFVDADGDDWLDFTGTDAVGEENHFVLDGAESIYVALRWDDWPASSNDYAVYLYRDLGDILQASSPQSQTGTQPPVDYITFTNPFGGQLEFYVKVQKVSAAETPEMDLFVTSNNPLDPFTAARSLTDPATSPFVTAVGAARWDTGVIEGFSSQGPTIDGSLKPDLTGPDGVDNATFGSFYGTSASSPHVAGAAALLLDASPCLEVAAVNDLLAALATDAGAAGPDTGYGAGRLGLGLPTAVADASGCVRRYSGGNRYATAAAVSASDFPDPVDTVFVATGANFPDGLAGAAVAARLGAPLLLVDPSGVPTETAAELTRLDPDAIVILGGTGAIPDEVKTILEGYAPVTRVAGGDRYETAVSISQYGFPIAASAGTVFVATGLNFPDALAAGAAAAQLDGPVLLVPGNNLPQTVVDEIIRLHPDEIVVVGGAAAVSESVYDALDNLQGDDTIIRISGADRYATAVAISTHAFAAGAPRAYLATGLNFPDALAGAAAAGVKGAPVLLVPGTSVPAAVLAEIDRLAPDLVLVLGGSAVISAAVERALEDGLS